MPMFDYRCEKCGHVEEILVRTTAPRPEHCGQEMLKQPSGASFVVNGYNYKNGYSEGKSHA